MDARAMETQHDMQASLEAQMRATGQSAGIRMMAQVMAELMRGAMGSAMQSMRMSLAEEQRQTATDTTARHGAVRVLRAIVYRLSLCRVLKLVWTWRHNWEWAMYVQRLKKEVRRRMSLSSISHHREVKQS